MSRYRLQFQPSRIRGLSDAYELKDKEGEAFAAGARILAGEFSMDNLRPIFWWKVNDRGKSRPISNGADDIADALRLAVLAATPRSAIAVLTGLAGVQVPVASAIMTAIKPTEFTVIDVRALESLGKEPPPKNRAHHLPVAAYLGYLEFCRGLAAECGVTLRDLDRALWQWSKNGGHRSAV